ncbi:ribokinase [Acidithiobacillus sp. M4-SHS-6]|uniref:ribokinase n=1 Tax=Acidithiobacillus sp. M4-SHS-6 TaxID=3383024 RepID=UPI0039BEBCA1
MMVMGSSNMDIVLRVPRAPQAGETVVGSAYALYPGGKGANQAVAAQRAGGSVRFVACLGSDAYGDYLHEKLKLEGMDLSALSRSHSPTGLAFILLEDGGQNRITIIPGANADLKPEQLSFTIPERDILLMQLEIPLETVKAAAVLVRERNGMVILNASPVQTGLEEVLALTDIVLVNEIEAMQLLALSEPVAMNNAISVAGQLASGRQAAVITLGKAGAAWATGLGSSGFVPGFAIAVVDTTGCGDAFAGAFSAGIAAGHSMEYAVTYANAAGALAAMHEGAQASLPLRPAIESFMAQHISADSIKKLRVKS